MALDQQNKISWLYLLFEHFIIFYVIILFMIVILGQT
jgi:hypothetical protein